MEIESYDLDLNIDFKEAKVSGVVRVTVKESRAPLLLDAKDIEIQSVKVDDAQTSFQIDGRAGILRIVKVPTHRFVVEIQYRKEVSDKVIFGLYKSRYGSEYFLVTDLEPAEARTVFPCKDDPSYKAVFNLEVVTDKGLSVISNSTVRSTKPTLDGRVRHVFNPTPRMSTYLFFLGIGKFDESRRRRNGIEVIAAARPDQAHRSKFILEVASEVLKEYSRYFEISYPLEKLHFIALPEYHTGAMENWGAITSREPYVLVDEDSGVFPHRRAALVMTHEIAHQWFGDLVTMKWWNDIWLNESFATFMEHKVLSRLHPEWDVWTDFLRFETFRSMNQDALSTTHPIEVKVNTPDEIGQVFDAISYGKGANVIRMIESYIGEEPFRKGVSDYLRRFSYSNAAGEDLWRSLQKASGQPVSRIMGAWVRKPGYPLVSVRAGEGKLTFSQSRFRMIGGKTKDIWPVPITLRLNGEPKSLLLERKSASLGVTGVSSLTVNPQHTGYYSVLYDQATYDKIARNLSLLDKNDKGGLMNDLYLFLQAGLIQPELYNRFVSLCNKDSDHLIVRTVTDQLVHLNAIAGDADDVRALALNFWTSQIHRLGLSSMKSEDDGRKDDREAVAPRLVTISDEYAEKLAKRFEDYDSVEPDMKLAVAVAYAVARGKEAFEPLVDRVEHGDNEIERSRIYRALTSLRDPDLVRKTLELTISGEVSRSDLGYALPDASSNPLARGALWQWVTERYQTLWETYGGAQQFFIYLDTVLPICGLGHEREVRAFLSRQVKEHGGITFKRTLERLEVNSRLRDRLLSTS